MNGMTVVTVYFASAIVAYQFVSEIRRKSDSLLWDLRVTRRNGGADVVFPGPLWRSKPTLRVIAETYGGDVHEEV